MADVPSIRPLLDTAERSNCMILKYLDDNILTVSDTRRLSKTDLRVVARTVLSALEALHAQGYVHTGAACFFTELYSC